MSESTHTDDTEEEEEAENMGEVFFKENGPGREEMASDYLPESDDWLAKTHLDVGDPAAIAALRNFARIYPEVEDLQPMIDEVLDELLRGRTSVNGMSREEYKSILMSMYGGSDEEGQGTAMKLVAPEE